MSNYKEQLKENRAWFVWHKEKLTNRLSRQTNYRAFSQILKVIEHHVAEILKIDKILKDGRNW